MIVVDVADRTSIRLHTSANVFMRLKIASSTNLAYRKSGSLML